MNLAFKDEWQEESHKRMKHVEEGTLIRCKMQYVVEAL